MQNGRFGIAEWEVWDCRMGGLGLQNGFHESQHPLQKRSGVAIVVSECKSQARADPSSSPDQHATLDIGVQKSLFWTQMISSGCKQIVLDIFGGHRGLTNLTLWKVKSGKGGTHKQQKAPAHKQQEPHKQKQVNFHVQQGTTHAVVFRPLVHFC